MSRMIFQNFGGIDQLLLQSPDDLPQIKELDKARWAATSVPTVQLFADPAFLTYADLDGNGRLRVEEIMAAVDWTWARLRSRARMAEKTEVLRTADLEAGGDGQKLKNLAERLLGQMGAPAKDEISLAQVREFRGSFLSKFPNGDGVVPEGHAGEAELAALVKDIVAVTGGAKDNSGEAGADAATLAAYTDACKAFVAWKQKEKDEAATVLPWGADTPARVQVVQDLAPKVAQFFSQCQLVAHEVAANARMQATPEELAALDVRDPSAIDGWLTKAPLAAPSSDSVLHLDGALNPRYAAVLGTFARDVAPAALGLEGPATSLTQADWTRVLAFIQPHLAWVGARPANIPADADPAALQARLDGPLPKKLEALFGEDAAVKGELDEINSLERLILYQRWLYEVVNNMVSFPALFQPEERALFEMGTLVLDGKKLTLCQKVVDRGAHKKIAEKSLIFLAYVTVTRKAAGAVQTADLAAAVTAGQRGGIDIGKRGVFYDRDNNEWDAIVVDVVKQPISVQEAMWAPVEKMQEIISSRFEQFFTSKQAAMESDATGMAAGTIAVPTDATKKTDTAASSGGSNMSNLLVGGSVAVAALGSSAAFIMQAVSEISLSSVVIVIGGLLAISGFVGWLRLRRRDISALLEAGEWALNGRMRMTHAISLEFTEQPDVPKGSEVRAAPGAWKLWAVLALLLGIAGGVGYWYMTDQAGFEDFFGLNQEEAAAEAAPADAAAAPAEAAPAP